MRRIKTRATLYALALILLLITIFTVTIIQNKNKILDEKTQAHRALLKNAFDLSLIDTQKDLQALAYELAADRNIVDAFTQHDRQTLYKRSLPYFIRAKGRGEVDLAGFIGADGYHFLRLQQPNKFGDNITKKRPILAQAIRTRQSITALDVTLYDVAIVTIIPIFNDNKFIGVIQAVAKIDRLQKRLDSHSSIKSAIAFDTEKLNQVLEKNDNSINYNGYTLVSSNDKLFESLPSSFSFEHSNRYLIQDNTYVISSRALYDFNNSKIAMITCAFDISDDIATYQRDIRNLLIISLFLVTFIGIILHYGFKILLRRIYSETEKVRSLYHELDEQYHIDSLTSLPNRNALLRDIHSKDIFGLILINIDNFKEINDFYGNVIGDKLLIALGNLLKESIEHNHFTLYKMHSDEFALLLHTDIDYPQLESVAHKLLTSLNDHNYLIDEITIFSTVTIGMNFSTNKTDLITRADMALKTAKKQQIAILSYTNTLQIKETYLNNILWSKKLREAIEENRLELFYQGLYDTKTNEIYEFEALIRIIDTNGEVIPPFAFLDIAKKTRLYPQITHFVIQTIFKQLVSTPYRYSINLSITDILSPEIQEMLYTLLRQYPVGDRLIFEILENEGIENHTEISSFIEHVKQFGCRIAIDDFGTGYSNFAHILRLNVDFIKIDASLIKNLDIDLSAQDIVRTIVEFAHRLNIKTIAEFVHSKDIYDECRELGIDYLQGYFLCEPKPFMKE